MRTLGFIFSFVLLFLGPSLAGSSDTNGIPGIGTFAFSGSAPQVDAPILMAAVR